LREPGTLNSHEPHREEKDDASIESVVVWFVYRVYFLKDAEKAWKQIAYRGQGK
jgi:hypothetical protein